MNVAPRPRPMTLGEFLVWEETQEERHEFDGVRPVAIGDGTFAHDTIGINIIGELGLRLRGKLCQPHGKSLKLLIDGKARYPDAYVSCGRYVVADTHGRDPIVLFEVLGDSGVQTDLFEKSREYASLPSVQRYVILRQDRIGGMMFERHGGNWLGRLLGQDALIRMPEIDIEIPIVSFYEGVPLENNDVG